MNKIDDISKYTNLKNIIIPKGDAYRVPSTPYQDPSGVANIGLTYSTKTIVNVIVTFGIVVFIVLVIMALIPRRTPTFTPAAKSTFNSKGYLDTTVTHTYDNMKNLKVKMNL